MPGLTDDDEEKNDDESLTPSTIPISVVVSIIHNTRSWHDVSTYTTTVQPSLDMLDDFNNSFENVEIYTPAYINDLPVAK